MPKMKDAKIVSEEILIDKYKRVVKERVQFSEDDIQDWIYLDSPQSVVIIALTSKKELVLVKLYRHNLRQDVYELPAGVPAQNESLEDAAKRELLEETGYVADKLVNLGSYYVLPSETNRRVTYFLAQKAKKVQEPRLDNAIEKYFDMSIEIVKFEDVLIVSEAAKVGITGAESLLGIHLAAEFLYLD